MTAPITPDERAAMRERYTADLALLGLADYERRVLLRLGRTAREDVPRLLDALDTAEAEVARTTDAARLYGCIVEQQCIDIAKITRSEHLVSDDGDADWAAIWDRGHELADRIDRQRDRLRAREEQVRRLRAEVAWLRPRVLPNPKDGCACTWHEQTSGPGYVEIIREDEPACPEHSDYLYDPRAGQWVARPAPVWDEDTAAATFKAAWHAADAEGRTGERVRDGLLAVAREHTPVRPDRETIARAVLDALDGCVDYATQYLLADAVLALWPGESRATVQAEALRDAADAAIAQDNTQGDWWDDDRRTYGTPVDWLRARADRLDPKEK